MSGNTGKRLQPAAWNEIRTRILGGEKAKDLAAEFGVAPETISRRARKEGWKRPQQLKAEAIKEAENEVKENYRELARKANLEQLQILRAARKVALDLLRELLEGRLPGQRAYQLKTVVEALRLVDAGIRESLRIDDLNNPFEGEGEPGQNRIERLIELLTPVPEEEAGITPADDDDQGSQSRTINSRRD